MKTNISAKRNVILAVSLLALLVIAIFLMVDRKTVTTVKPESVKVEDVAPTPDEGTDDVVRQAIKPFERASGPVTIPPLEFESSPQRTAGMESQGEAGAASNTQPSSIVKVKADQVLAVVNGVPLPANKLMLPSQFNEDGIARMSPEVLQEVVQRSIQRELILQKADVQGMALNTPQVVQLEQMYEHLTSNPLHLGGGWTIKDLNALGNMDDAIFHVRDKAARLVQMAFLQQAGQADTAEARGEFRKTLWNEATIQMVNASATGN